MELSRSEPSWLFWFSSVAQSNRYKENPHKIEKVRVYVPEKKGFNQNKVGVSDDK